jgi:hypothetical protein
MNLNLPTKMPCRWVAMEFLNNPKDKTSLYSEGTDVWSFGVTCWEILTFAKIPYKDILFGGSNEAFFI